MCSSDLFPSHDIPSFVDDKISEKITRGLSKYFEEVEQDPNHALRKEITQKLFDFSSEIKINPQYEQELNVIKDDFLQPEKIHQYSHDIWVSLKKTLMEELTQEHSSLKNYLHKNIAEFSENLRTDEKLQHKIDHWVQQVLDQTVHSGSFPSSPEESPLSSVSVPSSSI